MAQGLVALVEGAVFVVVHRVIGFVPRVPFAGILPADEGLWQVPALFVLAEGEPLVLNDAGIRGLGIGVVHGGVALEIGLVQQLVLKTHGAVFQGPQGIAKVGINGTGIKHPVRQGVQLLLVLQIIQVQPDLHPL